MFHWYPEHAGKNEELRSAALRSVYPWSVVRGRAQQTWQSIQLWVIRLLFFFLIVWGGKHPSTEEYDSALLQLFQEEKSKFRACLVSNLLKALKIAPYETLAACRLTLAACRLTLDACLAFHFFFKILSLPLFYFIFLNRLLIKHHNENAVGILVKWLNETHQSSKQLYFVRTIKTIHNKHGEVQDFDTAQ